MMALRHTDDGLRSATNTASPRESQLQRHGELTPKSPHLTVRPRSKMYNSLILKWRSQTHPKIAYKPINQEKFPIIKNWLGRESLQCIKILMTAELETVQIAEVYFLC